ncbi:MAG: response regulator [Firmicutes bacterium]|nr:response regulator [Bacillota bacterium]
MGHTVLVVDDSATMRLSLKTTLEMHQFQVQTAENGVIALDWFRATHQPPALVITDIHMPEMDGLALIRELRALPRGRFLPILVLTTESQEDYRQEARRLGATGWLIKPVRGSDLLAVIDRVLPHH